VTSQDFRRSGAGSHRWRRLFSIIAEEVRHTRVSEKLHTHAVNLGRVVGRPVVLHRLLMSAAVYLEGVAEFVGKYVDVVAGAVEVAENIWSSVIIDVGAIAANSFAIFGVEVHQLPVFQHAEEGTGLVAQPVIEFPGGSDGVVHGAARRWVAVWEAEVIVVEVKAVYSDALGLGGGESLGNGDDELLHLTAEIGYFLRPVVGAVS